MLFTVLAALHIPLAWASAFQREVALEWMHSASRRWPRDRARADRRTTATPRQLGANPDWRPVRRCSVRRDVVEGWVASARVRDGVLVLTSGRSTPTCCERR